MVLLKHLCREFDIDPYQLRKRLRAAGYAPHNRRWKWEDDDKDLTGIRSYLRDISLSDTTTSSAETNRS